MHNLLELLYVCIRKVQLSDPDAWPRANPMIAVMLWIVPTVHAVARLLGLFPAELEVAERTSFYTSVSPSYYGAMAIGLFIAWLFFDRRRSQIDAKFVNLTFPAGFSAFLALAVPLIGSAALFAWLAHTRPALCLIVFASANLTAWIILRVTRLQELWSKPAVR